MPDPRFFEDLGPVTLIELAAVSGARLARPADGERRVGAAAPLVHADAASVGFFADKRYIDDLKATRAGACFLAEPFADLAPEGCAVLLTSRHRGANLPHTARVELPPLSGETVIELFANTIGADRKSVV